MEPEVWEGIFPHVFLPRKLPDLTLDNKLKTVESNMLIILTETLKEFQFTYEINEEEDSNNSGINQTIQLFSSWSSLQGRGELNPVQFQQATKSLKSGQWLALYIRSQNAGLIISIPNNNVSAIISTFPPSLKSEVILASGKPNVLSRMYPAISVEVPRSALLMSEVFANQIRSLSLSQCDVAMPKSRKGGNECVEVRDVADPMLISKWLISSLTNSNSRICTTTEFPRIPKKIRDDVVWRDTLLPFRRSGMYMVLKVVLHLSLVQECGEIRGNFIYKSVMIEFMSHFCGISQDADLEMQILSKIARRLYKLDKYANEHKLKDLYKYKNFSVKHSEILRKSRGEIDYKWNSLIEIDSKNFRTNISANIDFKSDTVHLLQKSKNFFKTEAQPVANIKFVPGSQCPPRHRQYEQFPILQNFESTDEKIRGIVLQDIEYWVRYNFDSVSNSVHNYAIQIRDLFNKYVQTGKSYYAGDPLGYSRFVLTCLKMVQVFHKNLRKIFVLLSEHLTGVDIQCISNLLLPSRSDLQLAQDLENYFEVLSHQQLYPSLIQEEDVSNSSFAVRFASSDPGICLVRSAIVRYGEEQIAAKKEELKNKREHCADLRRQIFALNCKYYKGFWGEKIHSGNCTKCNLVGEAASIKARVYEKPLHEEVYKQLAVAFELLIPIEIACLRDVIFVLASEVCSQSQCSTKQNFFAKWTDYDQISHYKSESSLVPRLINLGSTLKTYMSSHYGSLKKHVDCDDSEFIVNNGYNTKYGADNSLLRCSYGSFVKETCTFKVAENSPYSKLQWTLDSTNHSQNQVLARQIECPQGPHELLLQEFKVFGSLRAGNRLQIRNIYSALSDGNMSFKTESVFALISQSVWEAGPRIEHGTESKFFGRSSHKDIKDSNFARVFLELLTRERKSCSENWNDPLLLLTLILIGSRILSISDNREIQLLSVDHLNKCRQVANNWVTQIKTLLGTMTQAKQEDVVKIRNKLIQCAACAALTFSVDPSLIYMVMSNGDNVIDWLKSIVCIDENVVLNYTFRNDKLLTPLRNILRWVRLTGLAIEPGIKNMLHVTNGDPLTSFVRNHWAGAIGRNNRSWQIVDSPKEQIYYSEWYAYRDLELSSLTVEVDIVLGTFLVNGVPIGRLPERITNHNDFIRVFQKSVFDVLSEGDGIFVTTVRVSKDNFAKYTFFTGEQNRLFVEELQGDDELQLFPDHLLGKDVPSLLISGYSHWWSKKRQIVYFRPIMFTNNNFHKTAEAKYQLNVNSKILQDMRTGKIFVDANKAGFTHIVKIMERLEHPDFTHVMYCERTGQTTVELPRMGLCFELKKSGRIISREFKGMQIAQDQKFGTLVGLSHGLLMENIESTNDKLLLVPHADMTIEQNQGHQVVKIKNHSLSNPPYFPFVVDQRLRQLKAGQNHLGWLYLSYLHAITASPLPDPFTGLTGTEAAMKLLQSGHCWSCEPMKKEAGTILNKLCHLSPSRAFYPEHLQCMQRIHWPTGLSSLAAEDTFVLLVEKLISESRRLSFLYPSENSCNIEIKTKRSLTNRAYFRSSAYSAEERKVSEEFDASLNVPVRAVADTCFRIDLETEVMKNVRRLAHLTSTNTTSKTTATPSTLLKNLLLSGINDLPMNGVTCGGFNKSYTVTDWFRIDLTDSWLDLYNFAKIGLITSEDKHLWSLLLCLLAFRGVDKDHLLILQTVAVNPSKFPVPPPYETYMTTSQNDFDRHKIHEVFKTSGMILGDYLVSVKYERKYEESDSEFSSRMKIRLDNLISEQAWRLTDIVERNWPTESCNEYILNYVSHPQILLNLALQEINFQLEKWFRNRELKLFLENVGAIVTSSTLFTGDLNCIILETITESESDPVLNNFVKRERLTMRFEDFLEPEMKLAWEAPEFQNALNIYQNGRLVKAEAPVVKNRVNSDGRAITPFPFRNSSNSPIESFYNQATQDSWNIHQMELLNNNESSDEAPTIDELTELQNSYQELGRKLWKEVESSIFPSKLTPEMVSLSYGGFSPRLTPTVILPRLCQSSTNPDFRNLMGTLCLVWTLEQRANRCLKYTKAGTGMEVALKRELANPGYEGWSPSKHSEWLLLQLEMDMMVRHVQIEVTKQMLNPPNNKNALMQLNMGEGKTAVIIPLLVVAIADKKQLCRVTVLRSLYQINLRRLIMNLGGLLNRRVYTFPCRRDMRINMVEANMVLDLYNECMLKSGVVLTRPEYRLSLQLKQYEKSRIGDLNGARSLLNLQKWLQDNVRDLLDESDEILQVKYQLIYTIGTQQPITGGSLRWIIAQDVFKLLKKYMKNLKEEYGENSIEYRPNQSETDFPHFRLLSSQSYLKICEFIAEEFINGRSPQSPFPCLRDIPDGSGLSERSAVLHFLTAPSTHHDIHRFVLNLFENNSGALETLLILRGILACGVLQLALMKRWRVNYGVNPKGERRMAVPFRAKDVAAEKTEFGHPDVAILFTQLSYYYSGLSDSQIEECFDYLAKCKNPAEEYDNWISGIENTDPSIRYWNSVNLNNFDQKANILFPMFKKNMSIINFWLGHLVFPKESKQFPGKMVCTAWDLCSDDNKYPVTGFSGTNDSALLLPLNILQEDLPQLQGTNGQVLHNLLLEENNNYKCIRSGKTCFDILRKITKRGIRVLLDVGALILELTNEQVATEWLEILPPEDVDAIVYFDESDRLVVRDRQGWSGIFETSSYGARLDRCAIYLDDVHTRGTDLKIPSGFKACVTLGKGVTKDKLVQGCMRMRMLGQGHTVHFFASQEVDNQIRVIAGIGPSRLISASAQNVLQWAMDNSCATTRDSMLYWAAAGFNFAQKRSAKLIFERNSPNENKQNFLALGEQCSDKEVIDLMSFYGGYRREEVVPGIAQFHRKKVVEELKSKLQDVDEDTKIVNLVFCSFGTRIIKKCDLLVSQVKLFSQLLEEEQERELEQELEEERHVSRPGPANPYQPALDSRVSSFLVNGQTVNCILDWCVKLPRALDNTTVASILQENSWGENIFATMDYLKVIDVEHPKDGVGKYLRTPTWIAVVKSTSNNQIKTLLLLSPFEANEYIPHFREGKFKTTLHMFSAKLRPEQDTLIAKMELGIPSQISANSIIWENLNIHYGYLSIFAGGLYFADKVEQDFFCRLCGYIPRPRSAEEQEAFDKGWTDNGFVKPEFRRMLMVVGDRDLCKFIVNPDKLIQNIIRERHDIVPTSSQISRVIVESKKSFE